MPTPLFYTNYARVVRLRNVRTCTRGQYEYVGTVRYTMFQYVEYVHSCNFVEKSHSDLQKCNQTCLIYQIQPYKKVLTTCLALKIWPNHTDSYVGPGSTLCMQPPNCLALPGQKLLNQHPNYSIKWPLHFSSFRDNGSRWSGKVPFTYSTPRAVPILSKFETGFSSTFAGLKAYTISYYSYLVVL